mmetsp:Transcript_64846/g.140695  ORF Transcript_64846/g.140695 Transcript_64846/m.140695 type:complete len:290 (-) Transcript_64846:123-992(-)
MQASRRQVPRELHDAGLQGCSVHRGSEVALCALGGLDRESLHLLGKELEHLVQLPIGARGGDRCHACQRLCQTDGAVDSEAGCLGLGQSRKDGLWILAIHRFLKLRARSRALLGGLLEFFGGIVQGGRGGLSSFCSQFCHDGFLLFLQQQKFGCSLFICSLLGSFLLLFQSLPFGSRCFHLLLFLLLRLLHQGQLRGCLLQAERLLDGGADLRWASHAWKIASLVAIDQSDASCSSDSCSSDISSDAAACGLRGSCCLRGRAAQQPGRRTSPHHDQNNVSEIVSRQMDK